MAIIDSIRKLLRNNDVPMNTSREIVPPVRPGELSVLFREAGGRHDLIKHCRRMYATDPRINGMIRMLARDVVKNGFQFTVSEGDRAEEAQVIADALLQRLDIRRLLDNWIRMAARDGDVFLEPGISARREIVEVTRKPTLQMVRLSDEFDRFPDPARAFAWTDQSRAAMGQVGADAVYFPQFLMIHARWGHDSESRYGSPEFGSAVGAWRKVIEGETDIAVTRKTRSGIKYVHNLIGASEADIEAYKVINEAALNAPLSSKVDFFINFEGGIEVLAGDSNLGELRDIQHHIQTMSAASAVPMELVAYGAELNRDVLEEKKAQYDDSVADARAWAAHEILLPLIERQWLLAGIVPATLRYSIGWPTQRNMEPDALKLLAEAIAVMRKTGWTLDAIWAVVEHTMPDDITRDQLFDEFAALPVEEQLEQPLYSDTMSAVQRLVDRLEVATHVD